MRSFEQIQDPRRRMRALAAELKSSGRRRLRLSPMLKRRLAENLARAQRLEWEGAEDENLRRLCGDARRIESVLHVKLCARPLCACGGSTRIGIIARELVCDGEAKSELAEILRAVAAFDEVRSLRMEEIEVLPDALRVAFCEAMARLSGEILQNVRERRAAERWLERGGRIPRGRSAVFFEHALRRSAESENASAREALLEERREERVTEEAERADAELALRFDNLMGLYHLLEETNWREHRAALSPTEAELMEDESYARMDEASRALLRESVAALADALRIREGAAVRFAFLLARRQEKSICFYFMDDGGRRELRDKLGSRRRLRRIVPDPDGRRTCFLLIGVSAAALVILCMAAGTPLLYLPCLPLAWFFATRLIGRLYSLWVKPRTLLKYRLDAIPEDARTLVALPVLLSSAARAREMVERLETLGCLERDANIDFLLLGDFRDSDTEHLSDDGEILEVARRGVERLNEGAEREKYFYLHRERSLAERDGRRMGRFRKRGALTALNRLILGEQNAAAAFSAEGECARRLIGKYKYVVTLDSDTEYLPGTIHKLVGAMLHPLNRRYALLQPCMQTILQDDDSAYARLNFGAGGVDGYPVNVSDFYQDMTGRGNFAGKGIYDVRAFAAAADGALPDEEILSHDLIEGILAGAGFAGDVCFYDGAPRDLGAELNRLHRWTRGDWQLLRVLLFKRGIAAVDRLRMAGNLLRSLYAPALLTFLLGAIYLDSPAAFLLGLAAAYLDALLAPAKRRSWRRATLQLAVLPCIALRMMDAIGRALWRLFVSRKHLLDWVPAADASSSPAGLRIAGRTAALLALPGLLRPFWIPAALALAMLFWVGADRAQDLAAMPASPKEKLSADQRELLLRLAGETWRFFEDFVPEDSAGLPPDNVQFDPPAPAARRTSPTNIGLYLLSCLSAWELGLLGEESMLRRMHACAETLSRLEKWRGQLYNWYDIDSLLPLKPRYVSAVDSGNLAAALLTCARGVAERDADLGVKLRALAQGMRLDALYDKKRRLFRIGIDVESGRISDACYDLYASEARLLSYAAMMLGQAPVKHWRRLSRPLTAAGGGWALASWSGTMFEYLTPALLLSAPQESLSGRSDRAAVRAQMDFARRKGRPWGVSESGFYAFDLHLNYQYRAFGLPALALSGSCASDVVAPYAAALALCCAPRAAAQELKRMRDLGWKCEYGMYEAADLSGGEVRPVKSCMAHHQGMILCSIANALKDDVLVRRFMGIPEARALRLLLQEKPYARMRFPGKREALPPPHAQEREERAYRRKAAAGRMAETHLLHGGGTTALVTARGAAFARRDRLLLNRFSEDLLNAHEGMFVHLEEKGSGERRVFGASSRAEFDAGSACFYENVGGLEGKLELFISPENGALFQSVELKNEGAEARMAAITGCFAAALAREDDMRAHPIFQNLFVETRRAGNGLILHRRARERGREVPDMLYTCSCDAETESSLEVLAGRRGSLGAAEGIAERFRGTTGAVLDPCAALRACVRVPAGGSVRLHFALCVGENCAERLEERLEEMQSEALCRRARQLAHARARAALRHAGIDAAMHRLLQRAAAYLFDGKLRSCDGGEPQQGAARELLWRCGVSGDLPILLMEAGENAQPESVHALVRAHAFYRAMGVETDLVILDSSGGGYRRPVREMIEGILSSGHLRESRALPGGAFLLDAQAIPEESASALRRAAALRFDGGESIVRRLRVLLESLNLRQEENWSPMEPRPQTIPSDLRFFNGYGGFCGEEYLICLRPDNIPPAPWSNILATETAGAAVTERGGGFAWRKNSRSGRLTPFRNDALREGWGWMFYLLDERERKWLRLLPGDVPMTDFLVRFAPGRCRWEGAAGRAAFSVELRANEGGIDFTLELENCGRDAAQWELIGAVDWLLGATSADARMLRTWTRYGACFASGAAGVGCFAADDPRASACCDRNALLNGGDLCHPRGLGSAPCRRGGWSLSTKLKLRGGEKKRIRFLLGGADRVEDACALLHSFRQGLPEIKMEKRLRIQTPSSALSCIANGFLQAQTRYSRILGRTGLYQPGGAYGFRDQLQDMLPLIYTEPERVRAHLLKCAARQFAAGDVLHWWHEPALGVRTDIRDDLLFLPYVAARYVQISGDASVLSESAPYLRDVPLPEGGGDVYAAMESDDFSESLHLHCMRAFRRAADTGEHGLCRMGGGDWNDGMNRVGTQGRGESVWLTQFLIVCAGEYAKIAPNARDRVWLCALAEQLSAAVEKHGWDGEWYLRAYADDGSVLGGRESAVCRIDLISQAWAVLAGMESERCRSAMNAAWEQLTDEEHGLIRLLTPPFDEHGFDPGYIAAYPPGIRENGAQYTHAACWYLLALIRMGDEARAHEVLGMLLPVNHALTREAADCYRVEPYVVAADIYSDELHTGRGGWTWYTGSAAWLLLAIYALLGFERRGNAVRLCALLGNWERASLEVDFGGSVYELVCDRDAREITLDGAPCGAFVEMRDDGKRHIARFPPRKIMEMTKNNMPAPAPTKGLCYNQESKR